jgi:[acyl-carrier-protein] S-malonyltransferase
MKIAFVFPGQGSQSVGMGKEFYENFPVARQVFEEVDEALHQKLSSLILEGSPSDLTLTENAQPALMAVSMAIVKTLEGELKTPLADKAVFFAGHSLGEYTAHCAARVFSLYDTAQLLRIRGNAMQKAVPVGVGAMAAILGLEMDTVQRLTEQSSTQEFSCVIANDNSPGQIVISGHKEAIDKAIDIAPTLGAKRALPLPVSAPFHCSLMAPAAETMAEALAAVSASTALKPIIANVTTTPVSLPHEIKSLLIKQVTGQVRWRESILAMELAGISHIIEVGAGKVLTGLVKRTSPSLHATAINTPADMDAFLQSL